MTEKIMRLVQLSHESLGRKVGLVNEPDIVLLRGVASVYELALEAIQSGKKLQEVIPLFLDEVRFAYAPVYEGKSPWKLLPSFDHPGEASGCLVSGTGLTHKSSALNRQMMHHQGEKPTDSLRMYEAGLSGGSPEEGAIGAEPEWFYKGTGDVLRAHGQPLDVPSFGENGGEEPEVAGLYVNDANGFPRRIGFTPGNEFSDHVLEKRNYLYLASSKLRTCAIGPELVIGDDFESLEGQVEIERDGRSLWSSEIHTGSGHMAHHLANLEHHHFKHAFHRIPFQAHVHFFGADAFSFGNGILLEDGDLMRVHWEGYGRPLVNPCRIISEAPSLISPRVL